MVFGSNIPLTNEDVKGLREDPELRRLLTGVAETQVMLTQVSTRGAHHHTTITGGVPEVFDIRRWETAHGRLYNTADMEKSAPVCVLGETVRQRLFPHKDNPTGERVRVGNITLEVIGVLKPKGKAPTGSDPDDQVFMPITTVQDKLAYQERIDIISTATRSPSDIPAATERIRKVLREKHRLREGMEDNFEVGSIQEMAQIAVLVTKTLNVLVVIIASISLIVGGIGIMNIMLVSVTERTREIGIRMAVGATPSDIRSQFLIEAVVLSMVGGLIGITLGITFAVTLTTVMGWPLSISPFYVALAFTVSAGVGVFFGLYPAAKAARLDPIEALRYE
jgi:putative ABC transport system permease protein